MLTYPEIFGGCWSTAPDPVDFRDFQKINLYRAGENMFVDAAGEQRPIASLTKMMTALVIAERHKPGERVVISAKAPGVEGSRIGVLKAGRRVPLGGLFLGLLMVSGNDAAVALAEHDAGTVAAFVKRMNRRAAEMGLVCTHFAGPAGLQDTGNDSCAYDLAALARADLANRWVASVTRRRSASVPFPVKGGTLELSNNHYFVQRGVAGVRGAQVTGVKTGLTNGAGRCYVTTARLGGRHLGVVLLFEAAHDWTRASSFFGLAAENAARCVRVNAISPHAAATSGMPRDVSSSSRRAASTRTCSTNRPGVMPTSRVKTPATPTPV